MQLIITTGTRSDETYAESHRWTIEVAEDAAVSEVLEQVKRECVPYVPTLNRDWITPYLYLTLAETFERLDIEKTVKDYALSEGSILHLMSDVR